MRMTLEVQPRNLYAAAFLAPVNRVREAPWYAELLALASAVVSFFGANPFFLLVLLLGAVNLLDFFVGSALAQKERRWDHDRARAGAIGKGSGVFLVLIIRALEAILTNTGVIDTKGAAAVAFAVILLLSDLRSYEANKTALTGSPTPGLRQVLDFFESLAVGALRPRPQPKPGAEP